MERLNGSKIKNKKTMPNHHILLAIDGTGSSDWMRRDGLNSHVHRFMSDFQGGYGVSKIFRHGPAGASGLDVGSIIDEGVRDVYRMIGRALTNGANLNDIKINLVGHSRGGFAVLKIANFLQNPISFVRPASRGAQEVQFFNRTMGQSIPPSLNVNFIGLYDAVKRAAVETEGDLSLRNVNKVAHAIRQNMNRSRISFSGIGIPSATNNQFDTSHGGIGGDPGFFTQWSLGAGTDIYCNALDLIGEEGWVQRLNPYGSWRPQGSRQERILQVRGFWQSSINADTFLRSQAQQANVPLSGQSQHIPWQEGDEIRGQQLRRIIGM